jgi:membrane-associated phospholipid phosphatase
VREVRRAPPSLRILWALALPLAAFAALAGAVVASAVPGWDGDVLRFAQDHYRSPTVKRLGIALDVSIGLGLAVAAFAVLLLLKRGRRREAIFWVVVVGGAIALDAPLKELFRRPALGGHEGGYSFPSGNAMASMAVLLALVLTISPRWRTRVLTLGVPFLVAYGAVIVYAWWHYPSDVLAGWCAALAWATASWLVLRPRTRPDPSCRDRRGVTLVPEREDEERPQPTTVVAGTRRVVVHQTRDGVGPEEPLRTDALG